MLATQDLKSKNSIRGFNTEVYDQIVRFLKIHQRSSLHTANNYERDIRHFFKTCRKKDIEHLTKNDLKFEIEEFEDYYSYLIEELKVSINTANRYIVSIRECMRHLKRRKLIKDISFLDIKTNSAPVNHYGILTLDEAKLAANLVLKQGRKDIGLIKHLMIKFAVDTCARLQDCLTIKWSNFTVKDKAVHINMIGKGNKEFKPKISKSFYEELLQLKGDSDYVFNIHKNTVDRMMIQLRKAMDISKERNITFHSFKKTGVQFAWQKTRDINQARKAANHSSSKTTEIYIDKDEDYGLMGAFSSSDGIDEELYKKVSHEELLRAIEQLGKDQQMYLNIKLDEMTRVITCR